MKGRESEQISQRLKNITSDLKLYIGKRVELLMLNMGEQMSSFVAQSLQKLTGIILLFGGGVFMLVALAIYLGEVLGSSSLGYVIVSVPLLFTGIIFLYLKPRVVLEKLQGHFESELVNALTPPEGNDKAQLNLSEAEEEEKG